MSLYENVSPVVKLDIICIWQQILGEKDMEMCTSWKWTASRPQLNFGL